MGELDCKPDPGSIDETSPLMVTPPRPADRRGVRPHAGADESSKSALYMFLLTVSIGGLQIVWSVELGNGSPYLLSLGMSKSLLAVVWIASPLTGALVQPYIGIRSDNCRLAWGKRKPFMVVGGAATIVSLLALAWVKEIVGGVLSIFGVEPTSSGAKYSIIIMATVSMYCLDFAINTVQAAIRAFIVDNCPTHQQELSNAWASRMVGVGNILGYIFGYMDLPRIVPWLGNTQFQVLCVLASVFLTATLVISCVYIKERDPRGDGPVTDKLGVISFFKQVIESIRSLPTQISRVCQVQIAAWVGWFPFLYYSTTYVGQLYANPIFADNPHLSEGELDKVWEDATRVGTLALLIYAIISFLSNTLLPLFVVPLYGPTPDSVSQRDSLDADSDDEAESAVRRLSFSSMLTSNASEPLLDAVPVEQGTEGKPSWLSRLRVPGLTLPRVWLLSHLLFALCMFSTFFIYSHQAGSAFVGLVGISWAVALWAPFALISAEVARIDPSRRNHRTSQPLYSEHAAEAQGEGRQHNGVAGDDVEHGRPKGHRGGDVAQAGIILGLHNMAVSLPQILSSLVCSAIFKASQKPRGEPWDDSVGWVLRFGGCAALVAAWLTRRVSDGSR
ncbi:Major facilitator superfamily domain general substrate transporter [Penicillium cf. griseofulvum]|uniref:Major facilitator superfamily domain general substrate transporter n=1 Tax=Penicillium cf. griseofulvum TaxID=2972120 RepID=A0A9W9JLZ5_9EURO|nr:Major facilitator superfamily domain general substrate transporter [Penicillium cf. griseofulvum]KAJ5442115.1 Major facilitator superfamily domain general substrate transporter [Penicillium cf. griseofulvum]KAJ5450913.1 Major facilitator superfamily domain general substrate transporter [Penicillium cf. griseofulvum]